MERRALLAFAISLLILIAYQEVIRVFYPPPEPVGPVDFAEPTPGQQPDDLPPVAAPPEISPAVAVVSVQGRDVTIETDLYRAVFTTAGGRLKSLQLKRYRATVAPDSPPLDVVVDAIATDLPLGLELRGAAERVSDAEVAYSVDREQLLLSDQARGAVVFTGTLKGATVTKTVTAQADSYLLNLGLRAEGAPDTYSELALGWNKRIHRAPAIGEEIVFDSIVAIRAGKLELFTFDGLETVHDKDVLWVGYSGRYFLAALIPPAGTEAATRMWVKRRGDIVETQLLLPPGTFTATVDVFAGPKEIPVLERTGHSLRRAVDLGWFTFVAQPLLQGLKLSHRVTGNYGIDIILLTVLIKILFIPLTHKSLQSMREMQKLQPQMTKLREQLKDKPDEMNKEIMELYRRHKVNPLGGCLPMVLQIPVFVGLYNALLNAVELRHAPFAAWINDLSAPDRLGAMALPFVEPPGVPVLTILMGVTMFIQQWMTPTAGADPTQQRIMLIMPVMFTFMFISFPAGLTLYWLVNNILTIAQQYAMNRPAKT